MKKQGIIFTLIASIVAFYLCDRAADMYLHLPVTENVINKVQMVLSGVVKGIQETPFYLGIHKSSIQIGFIGFMLVWLAWLYVVVGTKNKMPGTEHGSAKWGTERDIKRLVSKEKSKNMILTETESLWINMRKTRRNNNICVVGGSGSGKTRFFLKPNLMQAHTSYVITDPKGQILPECGKFLQKENYDIKVFNVIDFAKSMHYNPMAYIHSEKDILKLVNMLILNTAGEGEKKGEDFWVKAERLLYQALIGYIWYEANEEEKNFNTLLILLNNIEAKEDNEEFKSSVDILFDDLAEKDPDHFAVRQYKKYKKAAGKTAKSILISCGARLSPFDIKEVREITMFDELDLGCIGDRKTALFLIIDDTDTTFNFLIALLESQMFNELCNKADNVYKGRLPFHVRCLLDEVANIGKIPNFEKLVSTVRSREMSICPIIQNIAQLKGLYDDKIARTIVGNCDTMLFLGSGELETMKEVSEKVGKTTIDHMSANETKGQNGSYQLNWQIIARDLITPAEVGLLDDSECILFIRGVKPFKSKKFNIEKHKNYKQLADYDEKNYFDISLLVGKENEKVNEDDFLKDVGELYTAVL